MDNAEACVIRIRTLGDLGIWVGPKSVHIPSRRALGILVYLADQAGRTFTRDHLADLFWADKAFQPSVVFNETHTAATLL
jgi:hypothetical protein